jgi:methyltransferase (TIGR00027 family)
VCNATSITFPNGLAYYEILDIGFGAEVIMRRQVAAAVASACVLLVAAHAVEPGKPSVSALEVTAYRAIGAKHPDPAIRNGDTLALRFLGPDERTILERAGSDLILRALEMDAERAWESLGVRRGFALAIHSRTRHIDKVFTDALRDGAAQVVVLGAGLDSRAYRFDTALRSARVFEVDLSATQEYKKKRVRELFGSLPSSVTYVPIDFTKQDLATELDASGYDRAKKTIFVWEGVSFYLPEEAVDATLRFVATHAAPGSRLVFDYFLRSGLQKPTAPLGDAMARFKTSGEPLIFGLPDEDAQGFIKQRGLGILENARMGDLLLQYVPESQRRAVPELGKAGSYICTAVVR